MPQARDDTGLNGSPSSEKLLDDDWDVETTHTEDDDSSGYPETVQVLWHDLEADDDGAAVVIVFPRFVEHGGTLDPKAMVEGPFDVAKKLFAEHKYWHTSGKAQEEHDDLLVLDTGVVSLHKFQTVVRRHLGKMLTESGLKVSSFVSADGDETFLKISLPRDGRLIRDMAVAYGYPCRYHRLAYSTDRLTGIRSHSLGSSVRPCNKLGTVIAYGEFSERHSDSFDTFDHDDEVRLIERRLSKYVNMPEMIAYGLASKHFAVIESNQFCRLATRWATWRRLFHISSFDEHTMVCKYFGSQVAFFFLWFAFFTSALIPLAVVGLGLLILGLFLDISSCVEQLIFAAVMIVWAASFHKLYAHHEARASQCWGAKELQEFDDASHDLPTFKPNMEGTLDEKLWSWISLVSLASFMTTYMVVAAYVETMELNHVTYAIVQSLMIRSCSYLWSKIAGFLVDHQNHRTLASKSDELTKILSVVKITAVLFPMARMAFLKQSLIFERLILQRQPDCYVSSIVAAAEKWKVPVSQWPAGLEAWVNDTYVDNKFLFMDEGNGTTYCVHGCFPINPNYGQQSQTKSDCHQQLETLMTTFYFFHLAFLAVNIALPLFRGLWEVEKEKRKLEESRSDRKYTLLQYQAKCYDEAPYEFDSWGGSREDDFLDLVQGFAMLTCFGQLFPEVSLLVLAFNLVAYRLFAYRMLYVTCRPFPRTLNGIGNWASILKAVSSLAVVCNILLVLEMPDKFRTVPYGGEWYEGGKILLFVIAEHAMIAVQQLINLTIPDMPSDVHKVREFNEKFTASFLEDRDLDMSSNEASHARRGSAQAFERIFEKSLSTPESDEDDDEDDPEKEVAGMSSPSTAQVAQVTLFGTPSPAQFPTVMGSVPRLCTPARRQAS